VLRWASLGMLVSTLALADTRRVAIVAGNNAGTGAMPALRYAETDAGKMARVLVEIGDVDASDVLLLQGQTLGAVETAIAEVKQRIEAYRRQPDTRTMLLFYFSGHSDGESLEFGREKLAYARLKALLAGTEADVRLVIVDACRSGRGIGIKGARPTEAFDIKLLDTLTTSGEAFITSSAADEAALESAEVKGSFFTHHFVSGLRGAADTSGDRQITLTEAYRHAYERTVAATAALPVGTQHPTYDFRLSGQGELVLAHFQFGRSSVVLPAADRGLVTDLSRDQVVAEVAAGPARELALAPGAYSVLVLKEGQAFTQRVVLVDGQRLAAHWEDMRPVRASVVAAKGSPPSSQETSVVLGLGGGVASRAVAQGSTEAKASFRLFVEPLTSVFARFSSEGHVSGAPTFALVGDTSFDGSTTETSGLARAGYRLFVGWSRFSLGLGAEGAAGTLSVRGAGVTFVFGFAPRVSARLRLSRTVGLFLDGEILLLNIFTREGSGEATRSWVPCASATLGLTFSL
jgi:hypothetical protein